MSMHERSCCCCRRVEDLPTGVYGAMADKRESGASMVDGFKVEDSDTCLATGQLFSTVQQFDCRLAIPCPRLSAFFPGLVCMSLQASKTTGYEAVKSR